MNIYALICTRSHKPGKTLNKIVNFYKKCGIRTFLLEDKNSIFEAYNRGYEHVKELEGDNEFILILCHDDIEIVSSKEHFLNKLALVLHPDCGFVGVAGSKRLTEDGMWWSMQNRREGLLSGEVFHHDEYYPTPYGPYGEVAVLDGLFLAIHSNKLKDISLEKPEYFKGEWDYYDIVYCHRARVEQGLKNRTIPIHVIHHSSGELVGRDSWHENQNAFVERFVHNRKYGI